MKLPALSIILACLGTSCPLLADDDVLPSSHPQEERPVDRRMKIFPISKVAEHVDFQKVAYFRAATESRLNNKKLMTIDPKVTQGEDLFGLTLEAQRRSIGVKDRNRLAKAFSTVAPKKIAAEQRRPWAGGIKAHLVAFTTDDAPLFSIDLQTTTATEIVFDKVWPVNADLVRSHCAADYYESFYYEVDDAAVAAELFAVALEIRSGIPAKLPEQGTVPMDK